MQNDRGKKQNKFKIISIGIVTIVLGSCALYYYRPIKDTGETLFKDPTTYTLEVPTQVPLEEFIKDEQLIPPKFLVDFESLKLTNSDTIAWVHIPDTAISYPIVYTNNNDKYLHTSFEGSESIYGAIFLDMDSQPDFSGRHNILYGHNMKNGSMFKDIVRFKDKTYFDEHQDIYIYTPDREIHLRPIGVFPIRSQSWLRTTKFADQPKFYEFVQKLMKNSSFGEEVSPDIEQLYTFITCSYEWEDTRTLLLAVEVK